MFDGIDWNEQRAATGQVMRMLTCCEGIRKEKKRAVSARLQCVISSHLQGLVHRHLYCLTLQMMIQTTRPQFKRKCLVLKLPFSIFFVKFFIKYEYMYFFLSKKVVWRHSSHFDIASRRMSFRVTSPISEPHKT